MKTNHKTEIELIRAIQVALKAGKEYELMADLGLMDDETLGELTREVQSNRRIGKTKLTASQQSAIVRAYKAAFTTYGLIKSLARDYDVSEDTIDRVVNPRPKKTKQA